MGPKVVRCLAYTLQVRAATCGRRALWGYSPVCALLLCVWGTSPDGSCQVQVPSGRVCNKGGAKREVTFGEGNQPGGAANGSLDS